MSHSAAIGASKRVSAIRTHGNDELPRLPESGTRIRGQRSKAKETSSNHLSVHGRKTKPATKKDICRQVHDTAQRALDLMNGENDLRLLEPQLESIVSSLEDSANQLLGKSSGKFTMKAIRDEIAMFRAVCNRNRQTGDFKKLARNCARFSYQLGKIFGVKLPFKTPQQAPVA